MRTKRFSGRYWLNLLRMAVIFILIVFLVPVLWLSDRQAQAWLHPFRGLASSDLLRAQDIQYRDIELHTLDGVILSAWYIGLPLTSSP